MDPLDYLDRMEDRAAREADDDHRWLATLPPLPDRSGLFPETQREVA